jgi:hypothetical protein
MYNNTQIPTGVIVMSKKWNKEEIRSNLETDDRWLFRGITAIYARQTADEQATNSTNCENGMGFNGADAEYMSSIAQQVIHLNFLTPKQKAIARNKMLKYAGQLARIANKKI